MIMISGEEVSRKNKQGMEKKIESNFDWLFELGNVLGKEEVFALNS